MTRAPDRLAGSPAPVLATLPEWQISAIPLRPTARQNRPVAGQAGRCRSPASWRSKRMKRFTTIVGLMVVLGVPAAALAHGAAPGRAPAPDTALAQAAGVTIVDFAFSPSYVAVPVGSTVSWYNAGAAPHTATAYSGAFASGVLGSGGGYSATLWSPGAYGYFCEIHPGMTGVVEVY
jgi:plastocyanin